MRSINGKRHDEYMLRYGSVALSAQRIMYCEREHGMYEARRRERLLSVDGQGVSLHCSVLRLHSRLLTPDP